MFLGSKMIFFSNDWFFLLFKLLIDMDKVIIFIKAQTFAVKKLFSASLEGPFKQIISDFLYFTSAYKTATN